MPPRPNRTIVVGSGIETSAILSMSPAAYAPPVRPPAIKDVVQDRETLNIFDDVHINKGICPARGDREYCSMEPTVVQVEFGLHIGFGDLHAAPVETDNVDVLENVEPNSKRVGKDWSLPVSITGPRIDGA